MSKRILGLDLGTNSVGWAVVDQVEGKFSLINQGVRIFQEGVKIEKGIESSKAAERTAYRSARRIKYRRKLRKIETLKVLSELGYCPALSEQELNNWRFKKIYPQNLAFKHWWMTDNQTEQTDRLAQKKNPYFFRNLAATSPLDLSQENNRFAIGRAFYHMAQRRGFLSNRLESTKESEGIVKETIEAISNEKGEQTLGQYFYQKYVRGEKIRDQYTSRLDHYLKEFKHICTVQNLPDKMVAKLEDAIFYQRPLRSQKGLIAKCVFEPTKPRCPVSRPEFEEYRMLCFINNIKIKTPYDENLRSLTKEERDKILPRFYLKRKYFDFEDLAKVLAPKKQYKYYRDRDLHAEDWLFNYPIHTNVSGCPTTADLNSILNGNYQEFKAKYIRPIDGKEITLSYVDVWHAAFTFDQDDKLQAFGTEKLGLNEEQVAKLLRLRLPQDYASLSLKAIRNIRFYLREGLIYSHAVYMANMEACVPKTIWDVEENRNIIRKEIHSIIQTSTESKQIVDLVNGLIKTCKDNGEHWSKEAASAFEKDVSIRIQKSFGSKRFETFSEKKRNRISKDANDLFQQQMEKNLGKGSFAKPQPIDEKIKQFITDHFKVDINKLVKLYHPSALDVYKAPTKDKEGNLILNSPLVSSIRNPMAMRAMHQLRKVVNSLIKEGVITPSTIINIEMARGLLNANERAALSKYQNKRENKRKVYAQKIKEHFETYANNADPSEEDILKYQLWEEQNHKCMYTGAEISITSFLGGNPTYDIEHTIPRSMSFDNSQENKTLCESRFNRADKRNKIPFQLPNHLEIMARIEPWREKFEKLNNQISIDNRKVKNAGDKAVKDNAIQKRHETTMERNYWRNKYHRFVMEEVPDGFKNSQLVDTGIITKYTRLYLNTLFDRVYTVKGNTVADFRQMWGLQENYKKKERINHIHHCIDAITIACITKNNYDRLAQFYHDWRENYLAKNNQKPQMPKPWPTFAEDVLSIENELLVSHYTADVLHKPTKKVLRKRGKIVRNEKGAPLYLKGDSVRGALHKDTFYGAIERELPNKKGEKEKQIKYVVRRKLQDLEDKNIKNIVDVKVRDIVDRARKAEKPLVKQLESLKKIWKGAEKDQKEGIRNEIENLQQQIDQLYCLPNKNGAHVPIKKVRVYCKDVTNPLNIKKQRDVSTHTHKQHTHVKNDGNYLMAIYEAKDKKGKYLRDFEIRNNLECGSYFKTSVVQTLKAQEFTAYQGLIPISKTNKKQELPLKAVLKIGTLVILWEKSPEEVWDLAVADIKKRMYKIVGLSTNRVKSGSKFYGFGNILLRFHQEATSASELTTRDGIFQMTEEHIPQRKLSHNQFNALIENIDFKITPLGKIIQL